MKQTRRGTSHGWALVSETRKREIIRAIASGEATAGPAHAELDLTDRCNVDCYFCNQQDTRTKIQIPIEQARDLIDEMVSRGLRSVRLSGGGDPLHHKQIGDILDHLHASGVVVDNLTTNAVSLTPAIADRLIAHGAREVNVSLNAVDAADYHRMMQVKPALFDRVLDNVRELVRRRGEAPMPMVTVQFLLDRANADRLLEMVDLALSLSCDRMVLSPVQQIASGRVGHELLLDASDAERLQPWLDELFARDLGACEMEINLAAVGLGAACEAARQQAGVPPYDPFPTAPSFVDQDSGCFFAWYSTTITGNGDVYPCCQLIKPGGTVLGNVLEQDFAEVWQGEAYGTLRDEMREVLIEGADRQHDASRFKILDPVCHQYGLCWLKNIYFRADEAFYAELRGALEERRAERTRLRRFRERAEAIGRRLPAFAPAVDRARNASRPLRRWLKRRLGVGLTESA